MIPMPISMRRVVLKSFCITAMAAILFLAASHPAFSQNWIKRTFGPITFEIPADWKLLTDDVATQKIWYKGDPEEPDVVFSVTSSDIDDILGALKIESKGAVTVGGKRAISHTGTPKEESGRGIVIVFDSNEIGGGALALACAFPSDESMRRYKSVIDRILGSVAFAGGAAAPGCHWDSFTNDPRQFAAQPGGVLPLRPQYKRGKYLVHVGPAGKQGLDLPPKKWRTFGPYDITPGDKYCGIIQAGRGGNLCELLWEKNSVRIEMYSKPPVDKPGLDGHAVVYVRNEAGDQWYAVCLDPVGGGGAGGAPVLDFDTSVLQKIKSGETHTLKARVRHIPPEVKKLKFSWYLHLNECVSAVPAGNKANFWYIQIVDVRNGEAEGNIVMKAEAQKRESSFNLIVQDEPYTQKVFLSSKTISYQIR